MHQNPCPTIIDIEASGFGSNSYPIEMIASEAQLLLWDATKKQLATEHESRRHRASLDAYLIQQTYLRTRTILQAQPHLAQRRGLL